MVLFYAFLCFQLRFLVPFLISDVLFALKKLASLHASVDEMQRRPKLKLRLYCSILVLVKRVSLPSKHKVKRNYARISVVKIYCKNVVESKCRNITNDGNDISTQIWHKISFDDNAAEIKKLLFACRFLLFFHNLSLALLKILLYIFTNKYIL